MPYYVYVIQNKISLKLYVGETKNYKTRFQDHKIGHKYKNHFYIHKAIKKYGADNFVFKVIAEFETLKEAYDNEIELIAYYKSDQSKYGYNLTKGGEGSVLNEEQRKVRSVQARERRNKTMGTTKLTLPQVKEIKTILKNSEETNTYINHSELCENYNITSALISMIAKNKAWGDVEPILIGNNKQNYQAITNNKGDKCYQAKSTNTQADKIRKEFYTNKNIIKRGLIKKLANSYNLKESAIQQIIYFRTYISHLTEQDIANFKNLAKS
jgi:predicted GIY-YIG superfamily endonuclease